MKKILSLMVCMFLYGITTQAQTLIPKFGASLSTMSTNTDDATGDDIKNKLGITGGFAVGLRLTDRISIQPELLFVQKGFKENFSITNFDGNGSNLNGEIVVAINYLEVPVLLKAKFGSFYINAGPSLALGLGGKYTSKTTFQGSTTTLEGKIKFGTRPADNSTSTNTDAYINNRVDVGLQVGGGYMIAHKVMIDLRYGFGLINIFDKTATVTDNKSKLRTFQITVGVPIRLGKK